MGEPQERLLLHVHIPTVAGCAGLEPEPAVDARGPDVGRAKRAVGPRRLDDSDAARLERDPGDGEEARDEATEGDQQGSDHVGSPQQSPPSRSVAT